MKTHDHRPDRGSAALGQSRLLGFLRAVVAAGMACTMGLIPQALPHVTGSTATAGTSSPRGGPTGVSPEEIIARLMAPQTPRAEVDEAWHAIESLSQPAWALTLRRLVMLAQETHAVIATNMLIHGCVTNIEQLITDHIVEWSDESQRSVLQAIVIAERVDELRSVPRRVLDNLVDRAGRVDVADSTCNAIDVAAMLLADGADAADVELLRVAVRMRPPTRGLWLALCETDGLRSDETTLALTLLVDPTVAPVVRAAAAVAAAPHDDEASRFASSRIGSFLSRFGRLTIGELYSSSPRDELERDRCRLFQQDLRLIAMLRFLETDDACDLTFVALGAENEAIRQVAAVVAARRWPQRLLEFGRGRLDDHEYADVLALMTRRHPDLERAIQRHPLADRLEVSIERLEQFGEVMSFDWAGPLIAGW